MEPINQSEKSAESADGRIANAQQVRARALARLEQEAAAREPEAVTLPSGLVFRMRRPRPLWWALEGRLPSSLAARVAATEGRPGDALPPGGSGSPEEAAELSRWIVRLFEETVIEPKVRLNPGADEVDPNWLSDEDALFILQYAGGETMAGGRSLDTFSRKREPAAAGAGGPDVELPPEPDAGAQRSDGAADGSGLRGAAMAIRSGARAGAAEE